MARTLFGTDGIRGIAGQYPLDRKTVQAAGIALGDWVRESGQEPRVVIGMDTGSPALGWRLKSPGDSPGATSKWISRA